MVFQSPATRLISLRFLAVAVMVFGPITTGMADEEVTGPAPPESVTVSDHPLDDGSRLDVTFPFSPDDADIDSGVAAYVVSHSPTKGGYYESTAPYVPTDDDREAGQITITIEKLDRGNPYHVAVRAVNTELEKGPPVFAEEIVRPTLEWFKGDEFYFLIILTLVCGSVIVFVFLARAGYPLKVRTIAGLEAVDEAVGRATEMGKSCLFVPGIQDINDIQTVAGLTILSKVAETSAEYDAKVEVPTSRALVMTTAKETVQASYLSAGRPDSYNPDLIYYVTDEQFGYVAYLSGMMVREKPAACFYMGSFFAESLILAETGNSIGAIQVAGTAQPAQLPFFVAACDYTLIGEEFFAASAYLSGDPDQLGSLKGQDIGKIILAVLLVFGCIFATFAEFEIEFFEDATEYLKDTILN